MTEAELKTRWPNINWREPLLITVPEVGQGFGCRICIANKGFSAQQVLSLPQTPEEFERHIRQVHLYRKA